MKRIARQMLTVVMFAVLIQIPNMAKANAQNQQIKNYALWLAIYTDLARPNSAELISCDPKYIQETLMPKLEKERKERVDIGGDIVKTWVYIRENRQFHVFAMNYDHPFRGCLWEIVKNSEKEKYYGYGLGYYKVLYTPEKVEAKCDRYGAKYVIKYPGVGPEPWKSWKFIRYTEPYRNNIAIINYGE